MEILEIHSLDTLANGGRDAAPSIPPDVMVADLLGLMAELDPTIAVTPEMLRAAIEDPDTHVFVVVDEGNPERIVGTGTLCVLRTPTGTKGRIEDVVVSHECRGLGLGKRLLEYMIEFARREFSQEGLAPAELQLTSRPSREAANTLYRSLGFHQHETNVYKLEL